MLVAVVCTKILRLRQLGEGLLVLFRVLRQEETLNMSDYSLREG